MRKIKYIYRNLKYSSLILILYLMGIILIYFFSNGEFKISVSTITSFAAFASLYIALLFYERKTFEEKLQSVTLLKKQLEIIGDWTSYKKGGYHSWDAEKIRQESEYEWGNPFHNVFNVESTPLAQVIILAGTYKLGEDITESLVRLCQEIVSFNNTLQEIRVYKFSRDWYENLILHAKIGARKHSEIEECLTRSKIPLQLDEKETAFKIKLIELYNMLHFEQIGDESKERLFFWHKKAYEAILEKEKWLLGKI